MTYQEALYEFVRLNPGTDIRNIDPAKFNAWSESIGGFESAPSPSASAAPRPTFATSPTSANPTAVNIFGAADPAQTLALAVQGAGVMPNTTQVQGGQQAGYFDSTGVTDTTGSKTTAGTDRSTSSGVDLTQQTGSRDVTGATSGARTGVTQTEQAGTTVEDLTGRGTTAGTTRVADTLGLGSLLKDQSGAATSADKARQSFLESLVNQGPKEQQALTQAAVNQALSGPGMFGTGEGAQARAAGNAAAQVGLQSLAQQLEAARQLAGPTATTTLVGAGTPYLGQDTTGTTESSQSKEGSTAGATTATESGIQTSDTTQRETSGSLTDVSRRAESLNLRDLVEATSGTTTEDQSGTSGNVGVTAGIGTTPPASTSSGGGCVACTAYVDVGWKAHRIVRAAAEYKLSLPKYRRSLAGYSVYGPALARLIQRSPLFAKLFFPVARAVLYEELRLAGRVSQSSKWASLCHFGFHYGSLAVAVLTGQRDIKQCDKETINLLERNNLFVRI